MTLKFDSWASFSVPVNTGSPSGVHFIHTIKITNPKNNKSVTVLALLDSGAEISTMAYRYLQGLGLDLTKGKVSYFMSADAKGTSYLHNLDVQIGNLKPVNMPISVYTGPNLNPPNNLGVKELLKKMRIEISGKKLTYVELAQAAMGSAQAYYRSRF